MFRSAVMNAKYRVSGSHVTPLGIKTDAPMEVIWDIMRCWVKNHPVKAQSPEHPGSVILSKEPSLQVPLCYIILNKVFQALSPLNTFFYFDRLTFRGTLVHLAKHR